MSAVLKHVQRQQDRATDRTWNADIVFGLNQFHQSQPLQAALSALMPLPDTVDDAWREA